MTIKLWDNKKPRHLEASAIGLENKDNWICLCTNFGGRGVYMVDVLHEMGHIAGLRHEFARGDAVKGGHLCDS